MIQYAADHDPDRVEEILDWEAEDGLTYAVERLRREAARDYRFAIARYDVDRIVFAVGGTKEKPKPPKRPAILRDAPHR